MNDNWELDQRTIDKYNAIDERLEREAQEEASRDLQRRAVIAAERQAAALERIATAFELMAGPRGLLRFRETLEVTSTDWGKSEG